ncbi:hypothetical protein L5I01_17405 [Gordonia sp. HY442]|uniref:hypothetical protein n=1 Tax=Gordonia zhenghanii TaxID=2911516 RepID=UPI001F46C871|nr:hypothetical protein [Gordonia zhenghanii]MCF8605134.1 hypothetical protein [Gordonia zhenghanii]
MRRKEQALQDPADCPHRTYAKGTLACGVEVIYCTRCNGVIGEAINSPVSAEVLEEEASR